MPDVAVTTFDPAHDVDAIVAFLAANSYPFHVRTKIAEADARERVEAGSYWSQESIGHWVEVDGERVGIVVLEDVEDIADGGAPLFDLRLAEGSRSRGLGAPVLRAFTSHVFGTYPGLRRMEGQTRQDNIAMRKVFVSSGWVKEAHYREAWPVDGGEPVASVAYGILRRDWESGTTTRVDFDDLPG